MHSDAQGAHKATVDADDVLVFEWQHDHFRLIGGTGRGAGWANIVDVALADNPHVERAWNSGVPVRVSARKAMRVAGPYWAAHAIVVPVGQAHLVVFGGARAISNSDATLFGAAARAVAETGSVSAEKLLADELEVVHAVRALSCEVAAVQVRGSECSTLEVLRLASGNDVDADPRHAGRDALQFLEAAAMQSDPIVEQTVGPDPEVWSAQVVSRMTLPIGSDAALGALSLGHEAGHARGFTNLCQRIGRALAESAEPLLSQAIAHERLAAEHELLRRATATDALTGVSSRAAWEAAISSAAPSGAGREHIVLSADLDDLKFVNDHYGHAAGDMVLRSAANILRATLRSGDVLARVGGDEFLMLLADSDERDARLVIGRIYRQMRSWRVTEHGLTPCMSVGWAEFDGDWTSTVDAADERMYAVKQQRRRSAPRRQAKQPPRQQKQAPREEAARSRRTDVVAATRR